jgi:hypothetical protein
MFPLYDQLAELFDEVVASSIETADLSALFRARAVWRTFASSINHVLLAKTPLEVFETYHKSAKPAFGRNERGPYISSMPMQRP